MHICFIEDTHLHGGTQIWVSEAIRIFLDRGHQVTLLTAAGGFNARNVEPSDVRLVTYDFDAVTAMDGEHRLIWTDALRGTDVAVCTVHPPRNGFHCSMFAAECIAAAGLGTVLMPKTGTIVPEYKREYYVPSAEIHNHVIAITKFTRDYLVDHYGIPAVDVTLVYQGTEVAEFTPSAERATRARERYVLPAGAAPVLGNVGSFEPRKGQVVLLEALAEVRKDLPSVHLMLVGDGPDRALLEAGVEEFDLGDNVTFFPFTREPAEVFEILDLLVLASTHKEGLPNVLLEAMSMGLPVISTRLAGVPEVVVPGETGLMVEPSDVRGLANAIVELGRDASRCRAMGEAGQQMMVERFDKARQFDAFLAAFSEVLDGHGLARR